MEAKDFREYFCGREPDGETKTTILMILSMIDRNGDADSKRVIKEYSGLTSAAQIYLGAPTVEIDIHCFSHMDLDLNEFWEIVTLYYDLLQKVEESDTSVPLLETIVIPNKFDGGVFTTAINPSFHALTSDNPKQLNHIIALAFPEENFFYVEPEAFNITEYLADAEREAAQKIAMLEQDEIRRMKNGG